MAVVEDTVTASAPESLETKTNEESFLLNLDADSLVQCLRGLPLNDLLNVATSCRRLRDAAYSDNLWEDLCRKKWPSRQTCSGTYQFCGDREAYLDRQLASHQLRYYDPDEVAWSLSSSAAVNHLLLSREENLVTVAQGSSISRWRVDARSGVAHRSQLLDDHASRVTCIRSVPAAAVASSAAGGGQAGGSLLVSASLDRTIRLWGKNGSLRTLQGHTREVVTLVDKLLGREGASPPVLASGSSDCTVRLWSLRGGGRGKSPCLSTLYGHESAVMALAVAGHNPGVLISAAKDCKVRVWNAETSTSGSGACLGSIRGPGHPTGLVCDGPICYVAGGAGVVAIDIRSMRQVATVAVHEPGVLVLALSSSGAAMCTGSDDKDARLWDMRMAGDWPEPVAVMRGHTGAVQHISMDDAKVVTGCLLDHSARVWDAQTGRELRTLGSSGESEFDRLTGVSAIACDGPTSVIGTCGARGGFVRLNDFSNCTLAIRRDHVEDCADDNKFWQTSPNNYLW